MYCHACIARQDQLKLGGTNKHINDNVKEIELLYWIRKTTVRFIISGYIVWSRELFEPLKNLREHWRVEVYQCALLYWIHCWNTVLTFIFAAFDTELAELFLMPAMLKWAWFSPSDSSVGASIFTFSLSLHSIVTVRRHDIPWLHNILTEQSNGFAVFQILA